MGNFIGDENNLRPPPPDADNGLAQPVLLSSLQIGMLCRTIIDSDGKLKKTKQKTN